MKFITFIITFIFSTTLWAGPRRYDILVKFSIEDQFASSGRLIVKEGESAQILSKTNYLEVTPKRGVLDDSEGVLLSFIVGSIQKGKKTILSRPQILVKENEEAEMSVNELTLAVKVKRRGP